MARRRDPQEILRLGRAQALGLADRVGAAEVQRMMREAAADLDARLRGVGGASTPTSMRQMQATLGQLNDVMRTVSKQLGKATVEIGVDAAESGATSMFDYLQSASSEFAPGRALPIREAAMLSRAVAGSEASILRRLAMSEQEQQSVDEDPDTDAGDFVPERPMRAGGVLSRYSIATIGQFEDVLRRAMLTGKPWGDVRDELTSKSPFLEGAPRSWAERIVRTETMGAYNRTGWETIRAADDELGDMVKILSATFDDRTAWDSYQVHGQIRRPDEAFEWRGGLYQAPPNRPNDREVVVPHRLAWPIPDELAWRGDGEVAAAWKRDRRKGGPPARPLMTTVPLARFGREGKKGAKAPGGDAGAAQQAAVGDAGG